MPGYKVELFHCLNTGSVWHRNTGMKRKLVFGSFYTRQSCLFGITSFQNNRNPIQILPSPWHPFILILAMWQRLLNGSETLMSAGLYPLQAGSGVRVPSISKHLFCSPNSLCCLFTDYLMVDKAIDIRATRNRKYCRVQTKLFIAIAPSASVHTVTGKSIIVLNFSFQCLHLLDQGQNQVPSLTANLRRPLNRAQSTEPSSRG